MIIGITGPIAAGKTTIAEMIKKKGFSYFSYSDILRIEARKRGIEPTRENLQKLGTKVKKDSNNPGILSRLIIENAKGDVVADGIRTPDEIRELRKCESWVFGINASQRIRYERLVGRNRPGDPKDFESFKKIDDDENSGRNSGQAIGECMRNSDFVIDNNGTIAELEKKIDVLMARLR
ncbi:AAA family ATPase [Candidatus Woesearchaeota archaeon]|nr:AAA family ATPase [Candidatus Woesearchaeota archaeon]